MSASIVALADVRPGPRRVALGTFDGVHLGHRRVADGADAVVTFDPHPLEAVAPQRAPQVLTSLSRRAELLGDAGVRELVVVPFGEDLRRWTAAEFVDRVLVGALGAVHVSVGPDFRYGHRGAGDVADLALDERFDTRVVPVLESGGGRVSSSRVRALLSTGDVGAAAELLGAPYVLDGLLGPAGARGGAVLGVPPRRAVPAPGGYHCHVAIDGGPAVPVRLVLGAPRSDGAARAVACALGDAVDAAGLRGGETVRITFLRRVAAAVPDARRVPVAARSARRRQAVAAGGRARR